MEPNEIQRKNALAASGLTPDQQTSVTAGTGVNYGTMPVNSSTISPAASLTVAPPVNIPPPNVANLPATLPTIPAPTGTPAVSGGAIPGAPAPVATPSNASDLNTTLEGLKAKLSGKDLATATTVGAATEPYYKQLTELNAQIAMHQANALQHQETALGTGETLGYAQGEAAHVQRLDAIEALKLSALAQAAQGNIALAEKHATNAINAQFGQITADINTARQNILNNYSSFTADEKNRADATLLSLDAKDQFVTQQKDIRTQVNSIALEAAKNGLTDNKTLQAIQNAPSVGEATRIAAASGYELPKTGRYKDTITNTTDAFGNQVSTVRVFDTILGKFVDTNGKTATQLNSSTISSGGTGSASTGGAKLDFNRYGLLANTDFNPKNTVDSLAQRYLDAYIKTGSIPTSSTLGRGIKPAALSAVDQRARDLYFAATGTALPNPEIIKGYQKLVVANNDFVNNLAIQEQTVKSNFGLSLQNLKDSDLNTSNVNVVNKFLDNVKQFWLGNPEAAQYALQNATVSNEIGSLLAIRNASGTTVHDKLVSAGLISSGASIDQQKALLQTILKEAGNAKSSLGQANAELYKQIDPLLQDPNNPLRSSAKASASTTMLTGPDGKKYNVPNGQVDAFLKAGGKR